MPVSVSTSTKLTKRAFLSDMTKLMAGEATEFSVAELTAYADAQLTKLDEANAKRREKAATGERKLSPKEEAAQAYDLKLMEGICEMLTTEPQTRTVFAEALDITPGKVTALMGKLVKAGRAVKTEVKGEKGKTVAYIAPEAEEAEEA